MKLSSRILVVKTRNYATDVSHLNFGCNDSALVTIQPLGVYLIYPQITQIFAGINSPLYPLCLSVLSV